MVEENVNIDPAFSEFAVVQARDSQGEWVFTNSPAFQTLSFTKEWFGAGEDLTAAPSAWPRVGGGDVPVEITVTRSLQYEDAAGRIRQSDVQAANVFSLTYALRPDASDCALIRVNGRDATDDQRQRYGIARVTSTDNRYRFEIDNLENVGSMAVDGVNRTGTWQYRVSETPVAGCEAPAYFARATAGGATVDTPVDGEDAAAPNGGAVKNRRQSARARLNVEKAFVDGDGHWPEDGGVETGFAFRLAYAGYSATGDGAPDPSATDALTLPDSLSASVGSITARLTAAFGEIAFHRAGAYTFTITEAVPADATATFGGAEVAWADATDEQRAAGGFVRDDIRYDAPVHTAVVTVSESDGALAVRSVRYDGSAAAAATVRNTYVGNVRFDFRKAWLSAATELPATALEPWPEGRALTVRLTRADAETAEPDDGFALFYSIAPSGEILPLSDSRIQGEPLTAAQAQAYALARGGAAGNLYAFSADLPWGYAYTLEETGVLRDGAADAGWERLCGAIDRSGRVAGAAGPGVGSGGVLVNRERFADVSLRKEWRDANGATLSAWPSGETIDLTLTGQAGGKSASGTLSGLSPATAVSGTVTVIDETTGETEALSVTATVGSAAPHDITVSGLPFRSGGDRWAYRFAEAPVEGFVTAYANAAPNLAVTDSACAGGTITNRAAAEIAPAVTKRLLVNGADGSPTDAPDALWPERGFSFWLRYASYQPEGGDATQDRADALGALLDMPASVVTPVTASTPRHTVAFDAIRLYRAGTYAFTVSEVIPAVATGSLLDGIAYDAGTHAVRVTVTDDGGRLSVAGVEYDGDAQADSLTVSNTFVDASFAFHKVWRDWEGHPTAWPSGKGIDVTLRRRDAATGEIDADFALSYTLLGAGTIFKPRNAALTAAEKNRYALALTVSGEDPDRVYTFATGQTLAHGYEYFAVETGVPDGFAPPAYERALDDGQAAVFAQDTITNRDTLTRIAVKKRWRSARGEALASWPTGMGVALTLEGACGDRRLRASFEPLTRGRQVEAAYWTFDAGEAPDTARVADGTVTARAANVATASADGAWFEIALDRLPAAIGDVPWTYTVVEAPAAGCAAPEYDDGDGAGDGDAIVNRLQPAEQSLALAKRLIGGDAAHWGDGFTFRIRYAGYRTDPDAPEYEAATPVADGDWTTFVSDADRLPLARMPADYADGHACALTPASNAATLDGFAFYKAGVYAFTVEEEVPGDALKDIGGTEVAWSDATEEQRAAGGFVRNFITYDGRTHAVEVEVLESNEKDSSTSASPPLRTTLLLFHQ